MASTVTHPTAAAFRAAVESSDMAAATALLAPDVVFHSPVTFHPFIGRDTVTQLLGLVEQTFEDFRYTDELAGEDVAALIFRTRVGAREVEGLDLIRTGPDGRIADFTVMVRPLTAVVALGEAVGPQLAAAEEAPAS